MTAFPSYDEVMKKKSTSTKGASSIFPKFEDVVKQKPSLNKMGMDVSNHAMNPLNPNNQVNSPLPTQSKFKNFTSSIFPTIKQGLNKAYDIAGGLVAPGITHDELRNKQLLRDTATALPKSALDVATAFGATAGVATRGAKTPPSKPLDTTVTAIRSASKGLSDTITNGIINVFVPKKDRAGTQEEVQRILDKYLGGPQDYSNPTQKGISEGFQVGGSAAPYIAAGGIGGELAGKAGFAAANASGASLKTASSVIGASQVAGNTAGFLAAGQTQVPLESTAKERATQMANDLVALGLFEAGSALFDKVKSQAQVAITKSLTSPTPEGSASIVKLNEAKNSLTNANIGVKPGALERAKTEIASGNTPPVKLRTLEDGSTFIEDGRHHLQAATELGLQHYPVEDVTDKYSTSKVGRSLETKAIEEGLTEGFDETAGYDKITIKEQAKLTSDLLKTDLVKAIKMAMGEESIPREIRGGSLLKALEDYAFEKGDVKLIQDLANSPLAGETSVHAQELRMLAERNPDSPVAILRALKAQREARVLRKTGEEVVKIKADTIKEIQAEVKPIPKDVWASFIDSIKC